MKIDNFQLRVLFKSDLLIYALETRKKIDRVIFLNWKNNDCYLDMSTVPLRSGLPDLTLWNPETEEIKFVEVKGPGDKLSFKQILWIRYYLINL